jgi:hypothetical protein
MVTPAVAIVAVDSRLFKGLSSHQFNKSNHNPLRQREK